LPGYSGMKASRPALAPTVPIAFNRDDFLGGSGIVRYWSMERGKGTWSVEEIQDRSALKES
jgi:hypothetical protein